jgi:DNA-binding NtrC family response regulator
LTILKEIHRKNKRIPVIMVTAYPDAQSNARALRLGAFDYVDWDELRVGPDILATKMDRAVRFEKVTKRSLIEEFGRYNLIGKSEAMIEVFQKIKMAASCSDPVLLTGPSGSGKTHVARIIHHMSDRSQRHFIEVSTPILEKEMAASEWDRGFSTGQ